MGIVVVVGMEKLMGKRTENDENLKRYQERLAQLQKEGGLVPAPDLSIEKLMNHLAAEGAKLLDAEAKTKPAKVVGKIQPKKTDEVKLTETLGLTSKNPYIRARILVLQKYPEWRRKEIGTMEQNGDIHNKFYQEFVRAVAELGDQLSSK